MGFVIEIILIGIIIYLLDRHFFHYWLRRGFPQEEPSFLVGNIWKLLTVSEAIPEVFDKIYYKHKHRKCVGFYSFYRPSVLITDPELAHNIIIRDFNHFHDHSIMADLENDPLMGNLFTLTGKKWRDLRIKLTPIFTSGKLRMMFPTIKQCAQGLVDHFEQNVKKNENIFDIKNLSARFNANINSSIAFGTDNDCIKEPNHIFYIMGMKFFEVNVRNIIRGILFQFLPNMMKVIKIKFAPKEVDDFFRQLVKDIVENREKNNIRRNDVMDLLIQLKNQGYVPADKESLEEDEVIENKTSQIQKLTLDEVSAQAFVFFLASFETTSGAMSFCIHEIVKNPEIQKKVQKEIDEVFSTQGITYDAVKNLKYLDCCMLEALRKYAPVPLIARECIKDYKIPDTDMIIPKNTQVQIPVFSIQRDPEFYENPLEFRPERFLNSPTGNAKGKGLIYFPFGDGPRHCIGMRMAKVNLKLSLAMLLSKFTFELADERQYHEEMTFDKKVFPLKSFDDIMLKATSR